MKWDKLKLPECGLYLGTGVYDSRKNYLICSGRTHTTWVPEDLSWFDWLDRAVRDNQGNTVQIWGRITGSPLGAYRFMALEDLGVEPPVPDWKTLKNVTFENGPDYAEYRDTRYGAAVIKFVNEAARKGMYTTIIYCDALPMWAGKLREAGDWYLGYDFGERHSFGFDPKRQTERERSATTLKDLAASLAAKVAEHVELKKREGWGRIMATSGSFHLDYEIAAGTDVPVQEDFAFRNLAVSSALGRGLFRQHRLPFWGSHIAHEHNSYIPYANARKFLLLSAAMYLKYMHGCKMIVNESGNWYLQAQLCTDSPMFETPRVELGNIRRRDPKDFARFVPAAQKEYAKIDYRSPVAVQYRKTVSDFYDFVKAHGTPEGQPEASFAVVKGNYDICSGQFNPNMAIGGAYPLAEANRDWFEGAPERGWEIVKKVFCPCPPVLGKHPNQYLSATPHGVFDIVSFAFDKISAEALKSNYKALLFAGWNTCSDKQYAILKDYVENGGILCLSIPHFSQNDTRNYTSFTVDELVKGGDFSDLCGVRVKGRGRRIYWGTGMSRENNELGFAVPRRFGILATCLGDIEIVDPAAKVIAGDDEEFEPLIIRRQCGKGEVFFVNSWAYPGAMDIDEGPGAENGSDGIMGALYRYIAKRARGHVWITDDGNDPGENCRYVSCTYFPDAGKICLYSIDFDKPRAFCLHRFGLMERLELGPGEFRFVQTAKLKAGEKINWD